VLAGNLKVCVFSFKLKLCMLISINNVLLIDEERKDNFKLIVEISHKANVQRLSNLLRSLCLH